ncbi:Prevent-host-death protein [Trichormus variabilis ATCC 29413]|uniref:Prevent-host-death protein n=2 Tax=Anabaena variabilis TaxID=264691 RepID=Q3M433_TRIV2|nr:MULTISPECIES: type II toxin-antitoxin system prevent-host-death family antitoxin [Nostocaceae]ABA24253.1 Prevent-host-death protein [Trichormus variabilis ATCC 29413]MBC1214071.1 type II toxin-antitoxin system prevent-host-death family antitoxin [Trichormus variabilis ARAD]MBC1257317.1 type II toxin-antitoxin system prevent-host-death family antitoxin [Trichormus variabilis V5]MBC1269688.1 type II toxin-antitoxin system prevent-host-death family antitoxin [Trichormus variabilis FSR]MBC13024
MRQFPLQEIQNLHSDALQQATTEPIILTSESQSSYVIMSVENYEQLMNRITQLEDLILGQQAQMAVAKSNMIGSEIFTAELERLAALDD